MSAPIDASRPLGAPSGTVEPPSPVRPVRPVAGAAGWRVVAGPEFQGLLSLKRRTVGPMLAGGMAFFLAVLTLAGYARPLMAEKVAGPLNLGYALVLVIYAMCWGLAILYAFVADTRFDPQADRAVAEREVRS